MNTNPHKRLSETAAKVLTESAEFQAVIELLVAEGRKTKGPSARQTKQERRLGIKQMFTQKAIKTQPK